MAYRMSANLPCFCPQIPLTIPESEAFISLQELQRRLDYSTQLLKSDIKEAVQMPQHAKRTLRIYVSNTHAHQHQRGASVHEPPCWTLHISGRVLDEPIAAAPAAGGSAGPSASSSAPAAPLPGLLPIFQQLAASAGGLETAISEGASSQKLPVTQYFRRVEVRLDPAQYPGEEGLIVWEKVRMEDAGIPSLCEATSSPSLPQPLYPQALHVGAFRDQFEIKRMGSKPCEATVTIEMDWQPERFTLDPRLAQV